MSFQTGYHFLQGYRIFIHLKIVKFHFYLVLMVLSFDLKLQEFKHKESIDVRF